MTDQLEIYWLNRIIQPVDRRLNYLYLRSDG